MLLVAFQVKKEGKACRKELERACAMTKVAMDQDLAATDERRRSGAVQEEH